MTEPASPFQAQLQALRFAFAQEIPARVGEIEKAWADSNSTDETRLNQLQHLAHRLGGTASTFGFKSLGLAARELELTARATSLIDGTLSEAIRDLLEDRLAQLRHAGEDTMNPAPMEASTPSTILAPTENSTVPEAFLLYQGSTKPDWVTQLSAFGFPCREFQDWQSFAAALKSVTPQVLVIDDAALTGSPTTPGPLVELQASRQRPIPLIMLSNWPDLESRVHAVRAGGRAYLSKPPDILALVEALEAHSSQTQPNPYTVLVVEDDPLQASHHATLLRSAGMNTLVVNDPLRIMEPLVDGRPDLVLMDVYMPGCTGVELAAAIRQQEAFVGIPIVFLSQERVRSIQLEAMRQGGDDFLTKPVDPDHFLSIVSTRAERGRVLRGHMVRDSLTGLLNHSAILDRLDHELARAKRSDEPLAFAMLDLDHFKRINDHFGHAAGDRVLRSLARMLQQRLRKTDLLGRYGGEEFAIILPGATASRAAEILDDIRESFSALEFSFGHDRICVTFSAGLSEFPGNHQVEHLAEAADHALYRAKGEGRNRVVQS